MDNLITNLYEELQKQISPTNFESLQKYIGSLLRSDFSRIKHEDLKSEISKYIKTVVKDTNKDEQLVNEFMSKYAPTFIGESSDRFNNGKYPSGYSLPQLITQCFIQNNKTNQNDIISKKEIIDFILKTYPMAYNETKNNFSVLFIDVSAFLKRRSEYFNISEENISLKESTRKK